MGRKLWEITCQVIQAVTFLSDRWRSLNLWKDHLTIPKRSPAELPGEMIFVGFYLCDVEKNIGNKLHFDASRSSLILRWVIIAFVL